MRRRLLRLGILRGPDDNVPPARQFEEADAPSWLALCIGGWTAMMGGLMASTSLIDDPAFMLKVGAVMVLAFPVTYYLFYSRVSRWKVNWTVFALAVGLGALELIFTWPEEGFQAFYGLTASFRVLVKGFLWVLAFRAFAIRSLSDMALSVIPSVSCVILVMVAAPTPAAVAGTALVILGTLYLLAAEHRMHSHHVRDSIQLIRRVTWERGPRRGPSVNTWQSVSLVVFIATLMASAGASYTEYSSEIGRHIQLRLAQYLAGYLIGERIDYTPESIVWLTGEKPPEGDRVLFYVECDRGENWRQQVYADYTGGAWRLGKRGSKTACRPVGEGEWETDTSVVSGFRSATVSEVKQVFRIQSPFAAALPALFCATRVEVPRSPAYIDESGVISISGYLKPGDRVTVTSLVPTEGGAPTRDALPPMDGDLRLAYLQLPVSLPHRVGDLARQITADAQNEYDAAMLIRNYLVDNYPYDLSPESRPRGRDFVDHFLFDAKSGYCNHYSSAMAVLCRSVGLPARLVSGYVAGEVDPETDTYEVRAKDAHSWTEVYIEGRGWQPFEPTPPSPEDEEAPLVAFWDGLVERMSAAALAGLQLARQHDGLVLPVLAALLCLTSAGALHVHQRNNRTRLAGKMATPNRRAHFVYKQMTRWLSKLGHPRYATQPPLEYSAHVAGIAPPVTADVARITDCYLRARYGRDEVSADRVSAAEEALESLRGLLFRQRVLDAGKRS